MCSWRPRSESITDQLLASDQWGRPAASAVNYRWRGNFWSGRGPGLWSLQLCRHGRKWDTDLAPGQLLALITWNNACVVALDAAAAHPFVFWSWLGHLRAPYWRGEVRRWGGQFLWKQFWRIDTKFEWAVMWYLCGVWWWGAKWTAIGSWGFILGLRW